MSSWKRGRSNSDSWESEPRRTRSRLASVSPTPPRRSPRLQGISAQRRRRSTSPEETPYNEKIQTTDFMCLYTEGTKNSFFPEYIKKGEKAAPILRVSEFENITETAMMPNNFPNSEERPENLTECFAECVEEMFGGLIMHDDREPVWKEGSETRNLKQRFEKCQSIEDSYNFTVPPRLTPALSEIYLAFTNGYVSCLGRSAMARIFALGRQLIGKSSDEGYRNVGGNSAMYAGISRTVPIYCDLQGLSQTDRADEVKNAFDMEDGKHKTYVPDAIMFNGFDESFFFFGEVKSEPMRSNVKTALLKQVWHQSLRGLVDLKCVNGCAIIAKFVMLTQIKMFDTMVTTDIIDFDFRKKEKDQEREFNTENFLRFMKFFTKMIQEASNVP